MKKINGIDADVLIASCREADKLTDADIAVLERCDPAAARERRAERAEALARKADAERVDLVRQAEARGRREQITTPARLVSAANIYTARDVETFRAWVEDSDDPFSDKAIAALMDRGHEMMPAPMAIVGALCRFAHTMNQRNKERNLKIDALETRCERLEGEIATGAERVKAVEDRPGVNYEGIWDVSTRYGRGVFVTSGGSLWHAEQPSVARRPGIDPSVWKLAVKKGADGRNAPPTATGASR